MTSRFCAKALVNAYMGCEICGENQPYVSQDRCQSGMSVSQNLELIQGSPRGDLLRLVADSVPALIAYYEIGTLICRFANRRYAEYNGWTVDTIVGKTLQEAIGADALLRIDPYVKMALAGQSCTYTREQTLPDGSVRIIEVRLQPHFGEHQALEGAFVLINDITEHWHTERALRQSEERMRKFVGATEEGILFHKNLQITDINDALSRLSGYSRDEVLGMKTFDFIPERWRQHVTDHFRKGNDGPYEVTLTRKDGKEIPIECVSREMPFEGETLRLIVVRDITARRQAQARIEFMAMHDTLTQLPNRVYLMERLDSVLALARRHQGSVAVLFLDLDRFKSINDSMGHHIGDGLLCEVARRISATVRDSDVVSRLGGDEFIVVLSDVKSNDDAAVVAAKLIENITAEVVVDDRRMSVSPSIGISVFPKDGASTDELVRHADAAMYHAKASGRANYQFFESAMFERAFDAIDTERLLKQALINQEFVLHYQPQRRRSDGATVGLEALVRWQHPTRGLIGPDEFIGFAETHGLIASIDRWVLETACRQLKAWHQQGCLLVPVAVNLSALDFRRHDLVPDIAEILANVGLEAHYLEIEITESLLMQSERQVIDNLQQLNSMGIRLTIDDFGTGYSSLGYLKRYPVTKLKIDRSFVCDVTDGGQDQAASTAITAAIIQLARGLNMQTVAEGIETQAQFDTLRSMGCDQFQGFLISQPVSAQEARAFISGATQA